MVKEFVTYHQALALKELGFIDDCLARYNQSGTTLGFGQIINEINYNVLAPIYQQAFRFFRDNYNLDFHIKLNWMQIDFKSTYILSINYPTILDNDFDTYEEAERFAIDVLIKIAKEQQSENNQ